MRFIMVWLLSLMPLCAYESFVKEAYYASYNYEKMGNYDDAIKALSPLYERYPDAYTPNLRLGWLFFLNKNYNNAKSHYEKAAVAAKNAIDPKLGLARVYLAKEEYDAAKRLLYDILKSDLSNYYANYYLTVLLNTTNAYADARDLAYKMLALYPTAVLFLEQLARSYSGLEEAKKAAQVYEDILILDPQNVAANRAQQTP